MNNLIIIIWARIYPLLAIASIEFTKYIEWFEDLGSLITALIQWVIGGLTVLKLYKDLKNKHKIKNNGR